MLPLFSKTVPTTADQLSRALSEGFRRLGIQPSSIKAEGGIWPQIESVVIDLSGATATRTTKLPEVGESLPDTVSLAHTRILGDPVRIESVPVHFDAKVQNATAGFSRSGNDSLILTLERAESGTLEMKVARTELEKGLHQAAIEAAAGHGVDIKSTELEWESLDPRSFTFRLSVRAKAFIMSTTVKVRGRVEIDDTLAVRVSELRVEGEGVLAGMVEGFVKPHLAKIEGNPFALGSPVAGGLRVRDLSVACGETLLVQATFSAAAV
ncbi:MAG: hypothetical protein ABI680_21160 [Chthoniobacteraceae bacterium]